MAEIKQLNLPALFTAAQNIKKSQFEIDELQAAAGQRKKIAGLTAGAASGNQAQATQLAGLDPAKANDATDFFKKNILPVMMTQAQEILTPNGVDAEKYTAFANRLKQADPDLQVPEQPDAQFINQFLAEGEALLGKEATQSVNLKFPDGRVQAFDTRDPAFREALKQPNVIRFGVQDTIEGATKPPSGNRVDELKGELSVITRGRSRVAILKKSINDKRSRAGFAGTISRIVQEGIGITTDLADIGIDVPGFNKEIVEQVANDINSGVSSEEIGGFFDSEIPRNDTFVNGLAYTLAKARKGPGRLNTDDVKRALPDVQITGLKSVDSVLAKLDAVDQELAAAELDLNDRLGKNSTGGPPKFSVGPDGNLIRTD